jgi:hypothetical protein
MRNQHKHKCNGCGFVWEHSGFACAGDASAHTCVCGREVWKRYYGDEAAVYVGNCRPAKPDEAGDIVASGRAYVLPRGWQAPADLVMDLRAGEFAFAEPAEAIPASLPADMDLGRVNAARDVPQAPRKRRKRFTLGEVVRNDYRSISVTWETLRKRSGRTTVTTVCPFCGSQVQAYLWSLAGTGKRCACGALLSQTAAFFWRDAELAPRQAESVS